MKKIHSLFCAAALLTLAACDEDGDFITSSGATAVQLSGSGDVVLSSDNVSALALTLYWTDNSRLTTNDDRVQLPVGTTVNTLQFSATNAFTDVIEQLAESGTTSIQFTAGQLNALVGRVGLAGDVASPLYIRMRSVLANNMEPLYSNVCQISVTPYTIDMTRGYVLNADLSDTGSFLASPESNGIYSGFIGAGGWYNWWLQEGNGITWGNVGDDGGGKPFVISSNDQHWNFWFPGQAGCYYTVVNTIRQEWTALYIPALTITGDIGGEMTYDRKANKWTYAYTADQAGTITIQISGTGKQYNAETGTDDDAAIDTPVAFGDDGGQITFGSSATDISVAIPAAGEVTLTLDLSDAFGWTCVVTEGSEVQEEVSQILYVLGNDETWEYDQWLTLYDEDNLCYAAAVNFYCPNGYGYYFSKEFNDWIKINQDPSTEERKLFVGGGDENNIPAPGVGLYVTIASLGWMSYWYGMDDPITSVACAGFNDSWDLIAMTADPDVPGVYSATVTATADTPWGVQILLNGSWDYFFGTHLDGSLRWSTKENGAPVGWEIGKTYTFTVDLCKCTYSLTE